MEIAHPVVSGIIRRVRELGIGLITVDPFVNCHEVTEQDNAQVQFVGRQWARIAHEGNCAVELIHHTRKGSGQNGEPSADDLRGASALANLARSVRMVVKMSPDEAKNARVDDRRRFFRVVPGAKSNMALPPAEGIWRELVTIDLGNGTALHPADHVQAAMRWSWPEAATVCLPDQEQAVLAALRGREYGKDMQAADWIGREIARLLGIDLSDERLRDGIKATIKRWTGDGLLVEGRGHNSKGRERPVLTVVGRSPL